MEECMVLRERAYVANYTNHVGMRNLGPSEAIDSWAWGLHLMRFYNGSW